MHEKSRMGGERMDKSKIDAELKTRGYIAVNETKNIFIEAGAGAGKSTSLVNRIYHLLLKGVAAKNIYTITFTNKATEELRFKIVQWLSNFDKCTPEEIAKKKELLKEVDNIHISTIHRFCEDILKENAIKAGLSPDFKPAMDEDYDSIVDNVIRDYFRSFTHWSEFKEFEEGVFVAKKDIKKTIINIFLSMMCTADRIDYGQIYKCNRAVLISKKLLREKYYNFADTLDAFYDMHKGETLTLKKKFVDAGYVYRQDQASRDTFVDNLIQFSEKDWMGFLEKTPFNGKSIFLSAKTIFNMPISDIIQVKNGFSIAYIQICLKYAYELYLSFCADRDNDAENLANNDLIYRTYILLKNDKTVLDKTRQKIQKLFIDEYQDTDSLQYKVASLIANGKDDCLYIVGDPKQSIYRFRGAEPDVFFNTKEEFKKEPDNHSIYDLSINFRCNSKIVEWVNNRYSSINLIDPSLKYVYTPMMNAPKNQIDDADFANQKNMIGFYVYEHYSPEDVRKLIAYLKENKKVRKNGVYEPVQYKDIMVLMENHAAMPKYVEEFTRNNIPAQVYGESRFANTLAVRSFINLYSAILIDNQSSLAKAEAVFFNLYPLLYKDKSKEEHASITQGLLNELRNRTNKMNAYGKAIYLIEHMSLLMKENHVYEGFEVNFASSKLYQMVESVFASGFFNGNKLIKELEKYYARVIERESLIQSDIDAVMVINLHKAKGLEAPIVIWVSTGTRDNTGQNISNAYKEGILYPAAISNVVRKNNAYKSDVIHLKADEEYEDARKEYVAVTRAAEAFIFADTEDNVSLFHSEKRDYHIHSAKDLRSIIIPQPEEPREEAELQEEEQNEEQAPSKLINPELVEDAQEDTNIYEENDYTYQEGSSSIKSVSPSSLEAKVSATRETSRQQAGELPPSNRPKSNDVGTILHRALELLIKENLMPEQAVCYAINENVDLVPSNDNGEFKQFFITCVYAFNNWFIKEGYTLYPEFGFSYFDGNQINNGSIDLLMVNDNECIIVDYKSDEAEYIIEDEVFEKTLVEKYENQLNAYQSVVEHLFPGKPITKKIVYFRRYNPEEQKIDVKSLEL